MSEAKQVVQEFKISDALWHRIQPLLPAHQPKPHPLGCHRLRVDDRTVLNGIFFVLRTGCQWKALDQTGLGSGSTAHARFQEWRKAGVFARLWAAALQDYDELQGLDWQWLALDSSLHKAPLGGGEKRPQPYRPRQARGQAQSAHRSQRSASGPGAGDG